MSSTEIVCCKQLPNIADELGMKQTAWTKYKLLPLEQSDLGPHCLP